MEFIISNSQLKVTLRSKGAELCSIIFNEEEYLWQAKADIWPRHAPVLFPIVGKLKDNTFIYKGKNYVLPQHGFARDMEFECIDQTETRVALKLCSNQITKEKYPFDFELTLIYQLNANTILCSYSVKNSSSKEEMYFGIGAHPGFKIPINENENWKDQYLQFEKGKSFHITKLKDGLLSESKLPLALNDNTLPFSDHLFDNDALVFEEGQINEMAIVSKKSNRGVSIECANWPYFGIWSKKGCNEFVCIEPWYGIADSVMSSGNLEDKKGIIQLDPKGDFNCSYSILVF